MRNELTASEQGYRQAASDRRKRDCWKETKNLRPHDFSERCDSFLKLLCACSFLLTLADSKKSGNASNSNAQTGWSPPSIACEPIVPTPAMMRTDRARRTRWRGWFFWNFCQGKDFDVLAAPMGDPGATKRSACYIHPPHRLEKMRILFYR